MVPAILILTFAWTLKAMTDSLGAKEFVAELVKSTPDALLSFLPALVFIIACFLAFATGTSWGTFGMLIPIVVNAFEGTNATMMIISISACMAGAVCGDHCSPISDTTIMASAGAQCNHINHVSTQLPYAITVALVSFVTYIIAGFFGNSKGLPGVMKSPVIPLVIGLILLYVVLQVIKTVEKRKIQLMQNKRLEMKKTKGSIMLLFAAFFWGTTFVAQTTASDQIGTFTFNGSRSIVGAAFLALLILARTGMKKQKAKVSGEPVEKESIKRTVIGGILCGCVLFSQRICNRVVSRHIRKAWPAPADRGFSPQRMWLWLQSYPDYSGRNYIRLFMWQFLSALVVCTCCACQAVSTICILEICLGFCAQSASPDISWRSIILTIVTA